MIELYYKPNIIEAIKKQAITRQGSLGEAKTHYFVQCWKDTRIEKITHGKPRIIIEKT